MGAYTSSIISHWTERVENRPSTTIRFCFFTQTTHILIYYIAANSVINGSMTLGMLMALTYIIGQLSAPVSEFIGFAPPSASSEAEGVLFRHLKKKSYICTQN